MDDVTWFCCSAPRLSSCGHLVLADAGWSTARWVKRGCPIFRSHEGTPVATAISEGGTPLLHFAADGKVYVGIRMLPTWPGVRAARDVFRGYLKGASLQYKPIVYDDVGPGRRLVRALELVEISVVTSPHVPGCTGPRDAPRWNARACKHALRLRQARVQRFKKRAQTTALIVKKIDTLKRSLYRAYA